MHRMDSGAKLRRALAGVALVLIGAGGSTIAAASNITAPHGLRVSLTLTNACAIAGASRFISVRCSSSTPYAIGMIPSAGGAASSSRFDVSAGGSQGLAVAAAAPAYAVFETEQVFAAAGGYGFCTAPSGAHSLDPDAKADQPYATACVMF